MPDTNSSRHKLPYLVVAQAQKEITHNEALARIDALLHPVVEDRLILAPTPTLADTGKCWLIANASTGEWAGKANQIAFWAGGSWRYLAPVASMRIRNLADNTDLVWGSNQWIDAPVITEPQSGSVIDIEARAAIVTLLGHFRTIGQLSG